jgi:methionyl-tRNA formyltransferase
VVAYGLILPKVVIDAPRLGTVNIHASLLPRWRGAAPIQRSILAGDTETGITIMRVEPKLDAGPMLAKQSLTITDQTTASTLHDSLAELGAKMIVPVLDHLNDGSQTEEVQCEDQVTYAAKLDKDEGRIDWGQSAEVLHRKIRALNPGPGVWCTYNGERVKILEARTDAASGPIGQVVGEPLVVACGKRSLAITKLQRAGKAPLSAEELVRGYTIPPGSLFT